MSITYNTGIPDGPNNPSNDQPLMKVNTDAVNTFVGIDHVGFNVGTGVSGFHNKSTYVDQAGDPGNVASSAQVYAKKVTYSGSPAGTGIELIMKKASNDPINPNGIIQLTDNQLGVSASTNGYSFLPGGLIIQWGTMNVVADNTAYTFPTAFPNNCFAVTLQLKNNSATVHSQQVQSLNNSGFTIRCDYANKFVMFIAIGN
jgi:hypothetical protein